MSENPWQIIRLKTVGSTNDEAQKYCLLPHRTVVTAATQTNGRGRRGRSWVGLKGNLFFSLALPFFLRDLGALIIISSLSILEVIKQLDSKADVVLKWPNDVLLNGAKVSGMLLEKGNEDFMIVGIGINVAACPDNAQMLYPTTSLAAAGISTSADAFLSLYLTAFDRNMQIWRLNGIDILQKKWQQYAKGIGQQIAVQTPKEKICGVFIGINEQAELLLQTNCGLRKILAGDVFYLE